MKKKLLVGLLLATLAIGTLSPTSSEAATKKTTTVTKAKTQTKKTKTPTKIDGVAIKDLIAGKYNDIATVKSKIEEEVINYNEPKEKKIFFTDYAVTEQKYDYKIDKFIEYGVSPIQKRFYGKDYKDKTIDYGDGWLETYTDGNIDKFIYESLPYYRYNYKNVLKAEDSRLYFDTVTVLGSREEEVAKWKLDPSCFKTTKAKLTDDEIIIKGTYTFSVKKIRGKVHLYSENKCIEGYNFDRGFFDYIKYIRGGGDEHKIYKSVKCNATAIFYRDTKQLKSLELKAKLPKNGYKLDQWGFEAITLYNASYTFEHRLTEAQQAERASKITAEELMESKVVDFETIDYEYKSNYNPLGPKYNYDFTRTISGNDEIKGEYIKGPCYTQGKLYSVWLDSSRFKITSSEKNKNTITITGVYKLSTDSDAMYDLYAFEAFELSGIYGNYNDITADVTIVFDANTLSMKKVTLKYNFDNFNFKWDYYDYGDYIPDTEDMECSHIYTFKE